MSTNDERSTTPRGTPLATSWTPDWSARVAQREDELNRRICGARTIGGLPCPYASDHASGRCANHGGCALTGAPEGNRNAVVHGLYSRRLAIAGGSATGKPPLADCAVCPLELAEYNAVVTDVMQRTCAGGNNPMGDHLAHHAALLTVLVGRAARALAFTQFTQAHEQSGETGNTTVEKPSAAFVAFDKLSAELRRWMAHIEKHYPLVEAATETAVECDLRREYDTRVDPDGLAALDAVRSAVDEQFAEQRAEQRTARDIRQARVRSEFKKRARQDAEELMYEVPLHVSPSPAWDLVAEARNGRSPTLARQ